MVLVLRHMVLSAAVLAGGGDKEGFAAGGGVEAAGILVGRAVVVARPALGSKVKMWREVMGDTPSEDEIKATKAWVRKHNRTMAELGFTAAVGTRSTGCRVGRATSKSSGCRIGDTG